MKKIILSIASLIVASISILLVKANSKFGNRHAVFGLTAAGVCCTMSTCQTHPNGQRRANCQTHTGQYTVIQGPNGTLYKARTSIQNCKCSRPTLKWTELH